MTAALVILKAMLSNYLPKAIGFFKEHWKVIVASIVFALYTYGVYEFGYAHSDKLWSNAYDSILRSHNEEIKKLENDSKKAADGAASASAELQKKLDVALSKIPKIGAHDSSGKVLTCNGKPVDIYLGKEFVDGWNSLNEEGNNYEKN